MEYFAGLDLSMEETHICILDREGLLIREGKASSTPKAIAAFLAAGPTCTKVVFETGRMAPMLFHGLTELGVPVVCIESRQAYQALKSLAGHKTDRNDARGLAHLARTGFYKPTHVKSLSAHAIRSLIAARKKLVGQRVTIDNQIRGLVVVFGVRLPRALPGVGPITALAFAAAIDDPRRFKRSRDVGPYLGLVPKRHQSGEVDYTGSISKCGDVRVRTLLYEAANVMLTRYAAPLKLKSWALAIGQRSTMRKARVALARRLAIILHAMMRDQTDFQPT